MSKRVLVLDVGGTNLKLLLTGDKEPTKVPSGPTFTPQALVAAVKSVLKDKSFDAVSMGFPAAIVGGKILHEPANLGPGWMKFDFQKALGKPVKLINDAAMQALGSYEGGKMLFLGLGTGLGTAMIVDGVIEPMEIGHLPYRKRTYEDYVGARGLEERGRKKWRSDVADVVQRLTAALEPDYVVLGGGNVKELKELPPNCRPGNNANAFAGGFRLWSDGDDPKPPAASSGG